MSHPSSVSPDLFLLDNCEDFHDYALQLLAKTRRHLAILSRELDPAIFNSNEFVDAVSQLARSSRYAQIQILVKDTKPLVESGHKLVRLAQRLSSKIAIRKLTVEADDKDMGFMLCDSNRLLYKNDEAIYQGFANFEASVEVKRFRDTFDYLWQYGETDPDLQQLHI